MSWGYPPGVTGAEIEIAGPDSEAEETRYCDSCEDDTLHEVYRYHLDEWGKCRICGHEFEGDSEPFID